MKKLLAVAMLAAFVTPALAADEFYVVQDVKTKKCTVVDKKPTTTTETTIVGNGVYKTKVEAETGMKTVKVCEVALKQWSASGWSKACRCRRGTAGFSIFQLFDATFDGHSLQHRYFNGRLDRRARLCRASRHAMTKFRYGEPCQIVAG